MSRFYRFFKDPDAATKVLFPIAAALVGYTGYIMVKDRAYHVEYHQRKKLEEVKAQQSKDSTTPKSP